MSPHQCRQNRQYIFEFAVQSFTYTFSFYPQAAAPRRQILKYFVPLRCALFLVSQEHPSENDTPQLKLCLIDIIGKVFHLM